MSGVEPPRPTAPPTFAGDFTPEERALLTSQFSRCRFELIRRSTADPRCAIVAWTAAAVAPSPRGPAPLRSLPRAAVYVLRGDSLSRVATRDALEHLFGEPVGELSLPGLSRSHPAVEAAKAALRGLIPFR
jgi:hypothetical protein